MALENRQALIPGTILGEKYEILSLLGSGGFGITYLAIDNTLNRKVAIKELMPGEFAMRDWDSEEIVAKTLSEETSLQWAKDRFIEEARVLAQFDHPNIIHIHDYFISRNTAYMVTSYEEGADLNTFLKEKGLFHQEDINTYILPILNGLQLVHESGFLHRDIKPDNIYINHKGIPILLDFGAARQAIGNKTRDMTAIVTPRFAPLEQYSSDGNMGPWSDIYSLAAVIHKVITGDAPPDATTRIRSDTYEPLAEKRIKGFDHAFLTCVDWALEQSEERRPQTIAQWVDHFTVSGGAPPIPTDHFSETVVAGGSRAPSRPVRRSTEETVLTQPRPSSAVSEPRKSRTGLIAALFLGSALFLGLGGFVALRQYSPDLIAFFDSSESDNDSSGPIDDGTGGNDTGAPPPNPIPEDDSKPDVSEEEPDKQTESPIILPPTPPKPPDETKPPVESVSLDELVDYVTAVDRRLWDAWYADRIIRASIQPQMNLRDPDMSEAEFRANQTKLQEAFTARNNQVIQYCEDVRLDVAKLMKYEESQVDQAFAARLSQIQQTGVERKVNTEVQQKLLGIAKSIYKDEKAGLIVNANAIRERIKGLSALQK
tara:strand:- start:21025 stop:22821 length:1797 start_codon:yes stop_codon:yes gene_type:complete